ncbi:Urb2/Npa2 family-domain-containing protein [Hypoxylon sp. FL0543]|nr:Urb2/Npa2 family-domain-containing protein [Hypoxylon sp. FL0543]
MEVDSDSRSRRLALIRAVRTLDEDRTVALSDKIQRLWSLLSAAKNTRFHGVEENILRWLFKHMSGDTEDAEQVRRYPLTWSILSHVFPKVPLQTLGRSLASLRFVSILRHTVSDITTARKKPPVSPSQTNGAAPGKTKKRKRDDGFPSDIEELRTFEGCIKTATELLKALGKLLDQGDQRAGSNVPERMVGAEHIKSLFSSSNEETRDIAAGLILTCDRSLSVLDRGISQEQEPWIATVTALWNLRLHSKDDSVEFARHMYTPVCSILARLRGMTGVAPVTVASDATKDIWIRQLERFLSAYFIRPARHTFSVDENVEVLETALGISKKNLAGSAIVTWDVVARAPRDSSNPKSKAEHSLWAQNVFAVLLNAIQPLEPLARNQVIIQLLDTAVQTGSVPSTLILRTVCREHALSDEADWSLIAKIVACDADVFLMDDALLQDVFDKIGSHSSHDPTARETMVTEIILPLEEAFVKARNFAGFIQKWYNCLCQISADSLDQTIWYDANIRQRLAGILQSAMTPTQLLRLLEHLDSPDAPDGALLVVFDGISAGITEDDFINIADPKIFSAIFKEKTYDNLPSSVLSLKWRIAGRMASWETSDEVYRLWAELEPTLRRILKKAALSNPETFEAFSCCHKLWLANYPMGRYNVDLAELTYSFLERLTSELKANMNLSVIQPYLDYVFRYLPKLAELPQQEGVNLRNLIADLFWYIGKRFEIGGETQFDKLLPSLLHNFDCEDEETLIDALISHPINALDSAEARSGWTEPEGVSLLLILLEFPREALTKGRRKRIMSSWKKWRSAISTRGSKDSQFAVTVLRLLVKVMEQVTFYEGMEFKDLIYISSNLPSNNRHILALVERFIDLTLRHLVLNPEQSSLAYLADASKFVKSLQPKGSEYSVAPMLLMKGLVSALHLPSSSKPYDSAISLDEVTQKLRRTIQSSLSGFASESTATKITEGDDSMLPILDIALSGAACLAEVGARPLELTEEMVCQLQSISTSCMSRKVNTGWKLLAFLIRNHPVRYDVAAFFIQLEQASDTVEEDLVYDLVDAFVKSRDQAIRNRLLSELVDSGKLTGGPTGPLLAVRRLVELHRGPNTSSLVNENQDTPDFGAVHERLAFLLSQAESLHHFRHLSEILALLLDRHANSMTQFNIETTLSSVVHVCSQTGPRIHHPKAAGEIYDRLYKLVALVLKRHRHRLTGQFPILLAALRALLTTLVANPSSATPTTARPPWLDSRLQSRHAERFTRLVTLICEPSAASVARARSSELDSATDAAKRAAGRDMFTILELYIKLQLEVTVPRDVRKALEQGVYSILDITPQGCRRVLNESLDANGRAIFRQMFADYKKFGKWTGV